MKLLSVGLARLHVFALFIGGPYRFCQRARDAAKVKTLFFLLSDEYFAAASVWSWPRLLKVTSCPPAGLLQGGNSVQAGGAARPSDQEEHLAVPGGVPRLPGQTRLQEEEGRTGTRLRLHPFPQLWPLIGRLCQGLTNQSRRACGSAFLRWLFLFFLSSPALGRSSPLPSLLGGRVMKVLRGRREEGRREEANRNSSGSPEDAASSSL